MLIGVFGPPSAITYWTVHVMRKIADVCLKDHIYVETPFLKELGPVVASREGRAVIYFSDCPEAAVCDIFLKSKSPFVACFEDPADVFSYCVLAREMPPMSAMRFTFQSLVAIHDLLLAPQAVAFRRSEKLTIREFVRRLSAKFRINMDGGAEEEIFRRLGWDGSPSQEPDAEAELRNLFSFSRAVGEFAPSLRDEDVAHIVTAASMFAPLGEGRPVDVFRWERDMFLDPAAPDDKPPPSQAMLGPARHLVFGPYLYLPRGTWRATVSFAIEGNLSGNAMIVDVAIQAERQAVCDVRLPEFGRFSLDLDFVVVEPRSAIEIRILIKEGAIEGKFSFLGVDILKIGASSLAHGTSGVGVGPRPIASNHDINVSK